LGPISSVIIVMMHGDEHARAGIGHAHHQNTSRPGHKQDGRRFSEASSCGMALRLMLGHILDSRTLFFLSFFLTLFSSFTSSSSSPFFLSIYFNLIYLPPWFFEAWAILIFPLFVPQSTLLSSHFIHTSTSSSCLTQPPRTTTMHHGHR
jgi:hypothetical protein